VEEGPVKDCSHGGREEGWKEGKEREEKEGMEEGRKGGNECGRRMIGRKKGQGGVRKEGKKGKEG
jgi:hypothetical protein